MALAAMVRPGSRVADIGTDHALLPVFLVETGICPAAVAVDVRPGPAAAAERAVGSAGLNDRIAVRIGDGLSPVSPEEAEDIVIAGMGGETIVAILAAADWLRCGRYRLILQPMTHAEILHRWLYEHGFDIEQEHLIADGGQRYVCLTAFYAALPPQKEVFLHWRGAFEVPEGRPYWQMSAAHLERRAGGCEKTAPIEAAALRALADRLRAL